MDDLDKDKLDSVILMPKKGGIMDGGAGTSTGIKRPADDTPKVYSFIMIEWKND